MDIRRMGLVFCLLIGSILSAGAVELDSLNRDREYVASIVKRSEKIVDGLNISDRNTRNEVIKMIANRYFELNDIYETRDAAIETAKNGLTGEAKSNAIQAARDKADAALYRSHFAFPANLSLFLNDKQIEGVKDGMTYNVVHVTYTAQLDMIPTLQEEEKVQIYAWLVEAREFAMDAESAKKKHETFGKYKGRINNYLSKRGYNLTKEREEWAKRVKARGGTL
ncbi:DUF3826 domain-containing protein [Bacteroides sp.]